MLQKHCGEFGTWQLRHFVLTCLAWALEGFHTMVMIFADREPEFRCLGSGCDEMAKSVCGFEPGSWDWVGGAGSSTVAQWGLVCGEKYKVGLVQAVFFGGCMIGEYDQLSLFVFFFFFKCDISRSLSIWFFFFHLSICFFFPFPFLLKKMQNYNWNGDRVQITFMLKF
jgi:hypothetical protein